MGTFSYPQKFCDHIEMIVRGDPYDFRPICDDIIFVKDFEKDIYMIFEQKLTKEWLKIEEESLFNKIGY